MSKKSKNLVGKIAVVGVLGVLGLFGYALSKGGLAG